MSHPDTIHACFEQQANARPHQPAIVQGDQAISYGALNQAADALAHALVGRLGPGPEPVAFLLSPWIGPAVAMLGILKAGKSFVALDASYPQDHNAAILDDSQTRLLLADAANRDLAVTLTGDRLALQELPKPQEIQQIQLLREVEPLSARVDPESYAAIFYTSGSTDRPKGVVQTHGNIVHMAAISLASHRSRPGERVALSTSPAMASGSVASLAPLLNGSILHPMPLKAMSPQDVGPWLQANQINVWYTVPSAFRLLVQNLPPEARFPHFRVLALGGESLYRSDLAAFVRHFPPASELVVNLGSTETFGICRNPLDRTSTAVDEDRDLADEVIPVGYAVPGRQVILVSEDGTPVDPGQVGEIWVRSAFISPGYWRRPELTAARFKSDPQSPGVRIYRTGDLGRWRPDGKLEFLGRKDRSIKIRGHFVNPDVVEGALRALAGVQAAVVIADQVDQREPRLVAYVVPDPGHQAPAAFELRRALAVNLPNHLVPSRIVILDALPLLPGGKVDLAALPPPGSGRPHLDTPFVAPRSDMERLVAEVWAAVLDLETIGVHDHFIDLGGNSILAGRIVARLNEATPIQIEQTDLLGAATVAEMAARLVAGWSQLIEDETIMNLLDEIETITEPTP